MSSERFKNNYSETGFITERQLNDKIELNGSFCIGECSNGVCVKINDELFSVSPETVNTFFENEVLRRL